MSEVAGQNCVYARPRKKGLRRIASGGFTTLPGVSLDTPNFKKSSKKIWGSSSDSPVLLLSKKWSSEDSLVAVIPLVFLVWVELNVDLFDSANGLPVSKNVSSILGLFDSAILGLFDSSGDFSELPATVEGNRGFSYTFRAGSTRRTSFILFIYFFPFLVFTVCLDVYLQVVYGPVVVLVGLLGFAVLGYMKFMVHWFVLDFLLVYLQFFISFYSIDSFYSFIDVAEVKWSFGF